MTPDLVLPMVCNSTMNLLGTKIKQMQINNTKGVAAATANACIAVAIWLSIVTAASHPRNPFDIGVVIRQPKKTPMPLMKLPSLCTQLPQVPRPPTPLPPTRSFRSFK